jgi:hypothetical protein
LHQWEELSYNRTELKNTELSYALLSTVRKVNITVVQFLGSLNHMEAIHVDRILGCIK